MLVHVSLRGRIGNNLFQYALGSIIAQHHGCALEVSTFGAKVQFQLDFDKIDMLPRMLADFPAVRLNAFQSRNDLEVEEYIWRQESSCDWASEGWNGQDIPLGRILTDDRDRIIFLSGFFQRYEYYCGREDYLKRLLMPRPTTGLPSIRDDDVLLVIRGGRDYGERGWCLTPDFYHRALEQLKFGGRLFVSGVGINERHRDEFRRYRPIYFTGSAIEGLNFIMRFRQVVLANSTFAWWAAFLSDAETILAPAAPDSRSYSFEGNGVDLNMRDARYRALPCDFENHATLSNGLSQSADRR